MSQHINIIDLFAGPGGLGEGFSSFKAAGRQSGIFRIRASVEKEASAHDTLTLRALYRALAGRKEAKCYHAYVAGEISKSDLILAVPQEWVLATEETLQQPSALGQDNERIHQRIRQLLKEHPKEPWVVIGGPPCQAYSVVGRSRNMGISGYRAEDDHRHFLYREYLEILDIVQPDVFVMENVKGILTAKVGGEHIFSTIRKDLEHPASALGKKRTSGRSYKLRSFVMPPDSNSLFEQDYREDRSFVIRAERHGIPQARHRVILLGIATDIDREPGTLKAVSSVPVDQVLKGLPKLRSRLSKGGDDKDKWRASIEDQVDLIASELQGKGQLELLAEIQRQVEKLRFKAQTRSEKYEQVPFSNKLPVALESWLSHDMPNKVLNHESRGHIPGDLGRYFFSACWAVAFRSSDNVVPKAKDFPDCLAPAHNNWKSGHFSDRFRVQASGRPATTVTSHISKDGHYFIHPDPSQCRSFTVREAARIQTFPDNYFFEGGRTQQYVQVGNAVPPFLAVQLAEIVWRLLK